MYQNHPFNIEHNLGFSPYSLMCSPLPKNEQKHLDNKFPALSDENIYDAQMNEEKLYLLPNFYVKTFIFEYFKNGSNSLLSKCTGINPASLSFLLNSSHENKRFLKQDLIDKIFDGLGHINAVTDKAKLDIFEEDLFLIKRKVSYLTTESYVGGDYGDPEYAIERATTGLMSDLVRGARSFLGTESENVFSSSINTMLSNQNRILMSINTNRYSDNNVDFYKKGLSLSDKSYTNICKRFVDLGLPEHWIKEINKTRNNFLYFVSEYSSVWTKSSTISFGELQQKILPRDDSQQDKANSGYFR